MDRFPFAVATTNATDVGDLTVTRSAAAGQSSVTHGYSSGGILPAAAGSGVSNVIDRFPFAVATTDATDVGDLTVARAVPAGQSSVTHGYSPGGDGTIYHNVIDRFPFAVATTNATDVGDLTVARSRPSGQSSVTHGYSSGGYSFPPETYHNVIDRFPFAVATTNATDVGDLTVARLGPAGQSSVTHGYSSGGYGAIYYNVIDRFPFAVATTNATDVGDLTVTRSRPTGQSSVTHGYSSGGTLPAALSNVIDRFPFAVATTNATDVGDLTVGRREATGQQY